MSEIAANGIRIAYDEIGDPKAPAILLIMGLGTQMIAWPLPCCRALAERPALISVSRMLQTANPSLGNAPLSRNTCSGRPTPRYNNLRSTNPCSQQYSK